MRASPFFFLGRLGLAAGLAGFAAGAARGQSTGATFGEVIPLGGTPSDIVLDELRGRIYLVSTSAGRVDIWDYHVKQRAGAIGVGNQPLAAALSPDGNFLYVSNNGSATISVIDLGSASVIQTVSLPARPEGVAVGADGRVLITTQGSGTGNAQNTLLLLDRGQQLSQQVMAVQFPPPPPTPTGLPAVFVGRPVTIFRGKLLPTPDGRLIIGLTTFNNNSSTYVFVYEVSSGTILTSRSAGGQSTVLSMSPDGSRFMAGFTMYDTATLAVLGQQNTANAPFPFSGSFNTLQNNGGSVFSPDGSILYSAFNTAPFSQPATRPQAATLLISDPRNLEMKLGIKMPESIIAKMVITQDGADAWGLSESGMIYLPLSKLYDYPILQPETNQVFLAVDECNKGLARAAVRISNLGKGKLTFSVPNTGAALVSQVSSGVAPSTITFTMEPGRAGVVRQPGTNLSTGGATMTGFAINVNLASLEAINVPNTIRVYMNYRQADMRGIIYPVPSVLSTGEGLQDLVLDEPRGRLYVTNSGFNRVEVFDLKKSRFLDPIKVGQLPHQMALASDGTTLYVANTGGESISIVDLDLGRETGQVRFPPIPRAGNAATRFVRTLAMGLRGLQFIMDNGTQWTLVGNTATVRALNDGVTPNNFSGYTTMLATPGYDYIITLDGNGTAYLYDALLDAYTRSARLFNAPIQSYYGLLGAAKSGAFYLANGLILNSSLTAIGGAERPGATQVTAPTTPGQPPTQTIVSAGQRNVASVAPVSDRLFVRLTTPVRQNISTATRDDVRTTLESVDIVTGAESLVGVAPENPIYSVFGTARQNVPPRQMVVDSQGTAYAITVSGLSVIPLSAAGVARPQLTAGTRAIVNSADGSPNFKPGSFITVSGRDLAKAAVADQIPPPTVLGGSCVLFNDVALPLLQTSPTQISAQLSEAVRPGLNVVQVKSLATAQASDPVVVTVLKP
jgi:YVTN family beta-propeller protein